MANVMGMMRTSLLLVFFVKIAASYVHDGIVCERCAPGYFALRPCELDRRTLCAQCPEGSYSNSWNTLSECKRCRYECPEKIRHLSVITKNCTCTHDIVCSCKEGFWFDSTKGRCLVHRECPPGYYVKHNGTQTSDVVCEKCKMQPAEDNWDSAGHETRQGKEVTATALSCLFGTCTAVLIFVTFILIKKRKGRFQERRKRTFIINADHPLLEPVITAVHTNDINIDNHVGSGSGTAVEMPLLEKNAKALVHARRNIYSSTTDLLTPHVQLPASTQCNWPKGADIDEHSPNEFYQYDEEGGTLAVSPSATLLIPREAIPPREVYGVKGFPVANVQDFVANFKGEKEKLVAAIFQFDVHKEKQFKKHVMLQLEQCVVDEDAANTIKVYYCPSFKQPSNLTEIPGKSKENNIPQEMYYEVDAKGFVSIYTKHFSLFVVSAVVRDISVEARIYKKLYTGKLGIPLVRLRVYLSDYLVQNIKEYERKFNNEMRIDGYVQDDKKELRLPNRVTPETKFHFTLRPKNFDSITSSLPLEQCIDAADFAGKIKPVDVAEWFLQSNSAEKYFETELTIKATSLSENGDGQEESKSTSFYLLFSLDDIKIDPQPIAASIPIEDVTDADWSTLVDVLARKMLITDIRSFGNNLGFEEGEINGVEKRHPNEKEEVVIHLCEDWKQRNPDKMLSNFQEALAKLNLSCETRNQLQTIIEGIRP